MPEQEKQKLHEVAERLIQRDKVKAEFGFKPKSTQELAIKALFTGPSGTRKIMAAEILANELQLDLFRIDLSAVVNKYIGETEKNLHKLFEAAEADGAILFFDEADALFGKRNEVRDSHDRYANIEINYLLQEIEDHKNLVILATNSPQKLDNALNRRFHYIINFPPESQETQKRNNDNFSKNRPKKTKV